jgi:hypothetical protein
MSPKSPRAPSARACRWGQVIAPVITLFLPVVACVYDSDNRCGEGQALETEGTETCICAKGYATTPTGCVLCPENEEPGATGCVCKAGYSKPTADAPCAQAGVGMGATCDATSIPCTDATYNHCHAVSGTAGYCTTQGCTSDADCSGGYMCDLSATPAYCRRPPLGFGKACSTDADCAGTEATYCDSFMTKTCLVQGCTLEPDNCFSGTECCNLSAFGVAQPLCVLLSNGGCTT